MNNLEIIAEIDRRMEALHERWSSEIADIVNVKKISPTSLKYEKALKKLEDKYAGQIAELLLDREEIYNKEYLRQEEEYEAEFINAEEPEKVVDDYGRPIGKYWKDGKWVEHKKKNN